MPDPAFARASAFVQGLWRDESAGPRGWLILILLLTALAYAPGLRSAFVYDDHGTIVENTFLEQPAHLVRVLTLRTLTDPFVIDGQRPTLLVTAFLDRTLWGLNPFGWHLTNLLLHLLAVFLVFRLASTLPSAHSLATPKPGEGGPIRPSVPPSLRPAFPLPLLLALLFGLHPALTEAVQMPSYREDLLAGVCAFAYLLSVLRGRWGWGLGWFALALLSKESAVAMPALALLLWALFPSQRPPVRAQVAHLAAAGLLVAAYAWAAFLHRPAQAISVAWNGYSLPWPDNLLRAPGIFLSYLRLLVVPWPLCADRAVPMWPWPVALCGLCALLFIAWHLRGSRPLVSFGIGWLLLTFLPVSNLLPLFNPVGERYLYLMAPGLLWVVAGFASARWRVPLALAAAAFLILVPLRLRDWRNDETLWTAVRRVHPDSARAHTWLGLLAKRAGRLDEAAALFGRAEALNPHDVSALVNLAILDGQAGRLPEAEAQLREAVRRRPDRADSWQNLALALRLQGREAEAAQAEAEAAARQPRW